MIWYSPGMSTMRSLFDAGSKSHTCCRPSGWQAKMLPVEGVLDLSRASWPGRGIWRSVSAPLCILMLRRWMGGRESMSMSYCPER